MSDEKRELDWDETLGYAMLGLILLVIGSLFLAVAVTIAIAAWKAGTSAYLAGGIAGVALFLYRLKKGKFNYYIDKLENL
jgi:hypothetical protein